MLLLKEAIKRAARFIDRGKEAPPILKALRFIPEHGGFPARLYATNGVAGILVDVGQPLPNMALPAEPLVKLCKDTHQILSITDNGYNKASITTVGKIANDQSVYTLDGLPPSEFPGFPAVPATFNDVPQWWVVHKVVHAAGKDDSKPELRNVHFRPTTVEATDRSRVARAEVAGSWSGLVPAQVFKNWPKGPVSMAFTEFYSFWKVDSELRFAMIQKCEKYPDLEKLIPEEHHDWWMAVDVASLTETVKKASDMSPTASVVLDFGPMGVTVRAFTCAGVGFESHLKGRCGIPTGENSLSTEMLLNGKLLVEALKVVETPKVRLCYAGSLEDKPLRLESGGYVECLWPMLSVQPGA